MTKEQIIQNIKTRISTIESYRSEEYTLNKGILFELKDLLLMIEKDESYLSSNLDEAASEYAPDFSNSLASKAAVDIVRNAFKAGAEWMANQNKN